MTGSCITLGDEVAHACKIMIKAAISVMELALLNCFLVIAKHEIRKIQPKGKLISFYYEVFHARTVPIELFANLLPPPQYFFLKQSLPFMENDFDRIY
jgi:hypothetical protein